MPQNIDVISMEKSLIDLAALPKNTFNSAFIGYDLANILDDTILAEFVDESPTGEMMRGGLVIPTNADTRAWRIGKALLIGPNTKIIKVGDYIMFPNNMGIPISNVDVINHGKVDKAIFINEARIFGRVEPRKETNTIANNVIKSKKSRVK